MPPLLTTPSAASGSAQEPNAPIAHQAGEAYQAGESAVPDLSDTAKRVPRAAGEEDLPGSTLRIQSILDTLSTFNPHLSASDRTLLAELAQPWPLQISNGPEIVLHISDTQDHGFLSVLSLMFGAYPAPAKDTAPRDPASDDTAPDIPGHNRVTGSASDDHLSGGSGKDFIDGGAGDDTLDGGEGIDRLTGGNGADLFVFAPNGARDYITDFQPGQDRIDLTAYADRGLTTFDGLTLTQDGATTLIGLIGDSAITLFDTDIAQLDADDFLF